MSQQITEEDSEVLYGDVTPRNFDEGVTVSDTIFSDQTFYALEESIFTARPDIKEFIAAHGDKSFHEYTKIHTRENRNPIIKARKSELHQVVRCEVAPLLGSKIAASVVRQLKGNDGVSTIQHGVPLGHPYILSAVFQNALPYFGASHPNLENVIVMSNSLASFNNYSFPKADALHIVGETPPAVSQFPLFGQSHEAFSTIFHAPFGEISLEEMNKKVLQLGQNGKINKANLQHLNDILSDVFASPHILAQKSYTDQLTVLNYYMWQKITHGCTKKVPNLIFLSQESIVLKLLQTFHMHSETVLGKLLFDRKYHALFNTHFDGLNGAFNSNKQTGTFLFWHHSKKTGHKERLLLHDGVLKTSDGTYQIALLPESISHALLHDELIPSTSLVFIVLAFYYGLYLGGGVAQAANIEALQEAYVALLQEVSDSEDVKALEGLTISNTVISRPTFLYMDDHGVRVPVTGLDIALYGNQLNWDAVIESTKNVSLRDVLKRLYPFYYSQFVKEKDSVLRRINERDIEERIGLDQKIPPLFTVSKDS